VEAEKCPFEFNFDPQTFKVGDVVSYRVPEMFGDMPFVGTLVAVEADSVLICAGDPKEPDRRMRGTRRNPGVYTPGYEPPPLRG